MRPEARLRGLQDLLELAPLCLARLAHQELGVPQDDAQRVVEVVGDAAGQTADRLHLLRLQQLRLEPLALGDVLEGHSHAVAGQREDLHGEYAIVGALTVAFPHLAQVSSLPREEHLPVLAGVVRIEHVRERVIHALSEDVLGTHTKGVGGGRVGGDQLEAPQVLAVLEAPDVQPHLHVAKDVGIAAQLRGLELQVRRRSRLIVLGACALDDLLLQRARALGDLAVQLGVQLGQLGRLPGQPLVAAKRAQHSRDSWSAGRQTRRGRAMTSPPRR